MLESKTKFDVKSISRERPFTADTFAGWTNNNMYRTSYNDMSVKVSSKLGLNGSSLLWPIESFISLSIKALFQIKQLGTCSDRLTLK
jgi:hypothetical protein